jgi:hypothetical protein
MHGNLEEKLSNANEQNEELKNSLTALQSVKAV